MASIASLAQIRLEVRPANGRPTVYEVGDGGFLIGGVPGCDLRLAGANLPPVLCLVARHADGASLRKLAPVQPVLVNGRAVSSTYLQDGDKVGLPGVELVVSVSGAAAPAIDVEGKVRDIEQREQQLEDALARLEADKTQWLRKRDEIQAEVQRQGKALSSVTQRFREQDEELSETRSDLERREAAWNEARHELEQARLDLEARTAELAKEKDEVATLRREMGRIRKELADRYQKRRERMEKQQLAVHRAARRLQERKRKLDSNVEQAARAQADLDARKAAWEEEVTRARDDQRLAQAGLEARAEQLTRERGLYEEQAQEINRKQHTSQQELASRLADVEARERTLLEEKVELEKGQRQHQADLVRLDRIQATHEQRQKQLQAQALEVDKRYEQLQRDTRDLEEQAAQLDAWHNRMAEENQKVARLKQEQETTTAELDKRAAALEGQQAMLATLRTRLERMREELRKQEETLGDQRVLQEATESDLKQRTEAAARLREELDNDKQLFEQERSRFAERQTTLDEAVAHLRQAQEAMEADQARFREQQQHVDATAAEQSEQAALLLARGSQLEELHKRLLDDRQTLKDREATLTRAEQTLGQLQEQLRRRSDELNDRQQQHVERDQSLEEQRTRLEEERRALEETHRLGQEELATARQALEARAAALDARKAEMDQRLESLQREAERLEQSGESLGTQRQALATERIAFEVDRQAAAEAATRARQEFEAARDEALELTRQLPELEARAAVAMDRLARAREQLREHLAEVHTYARQSREDLDSARKSVQEDVERVRQQELALQVARDEHRLAVAAFRQQLIEWQGKVGEMRQLLLQGETQLERRRAEVDEQAQQLATTTARLAQQAQDLEAEQKRVAERREEIDHHLADMREWYRRKLRELSGVDVPAEAVGADEPTPGRDILALTGEVEPGDQQLGDLLRSLELVDSDTLTALLIEARRQRKSLRQLLLAGNFLTLYQMALIETGDVAGLVLGPVRVIDRLGSGTREAVYKVFDPRSGHEAVLRHLAESEMADAVRPDEFRQRFGAAASVQHPHVAATHEVLEIGGRPAALQEWVGGVPSSDWPALASAPGVWYRLLTQAALGLQAIHAAGLDHGRIGPESMSLTGDGTVKLCGLGEPSWLTAADGDGADTTTDLVALGRVAADWLTSGGTRKGKAKPLPEKLQAVLDRLIAEDATLRFTTATALLEELEQASAEVPANTTAWERFLRQVREQADAGVRQSA